MSIILHQFPISHFCEKVRWALDYKGIDYEANNLLPGLHVKTTTKLAKSSAVPVLQHNGEAIQNSSVILDYLEHEFPAKPLTPSDPKLLAEVKEWEDFCDKELGPTVRCFCYHILLDRPNIVIPFFTQGAAWWTPYFLKVIFPKLAVKMRAWMKINEQSAQESQQRIEAALDKINAHLNGRDFLVGDQFTRADLTAAALLAPLLMPEGYGLDWPDEVPERLREMIDKNADKLEFAHKLYRDFR